MFELITLALLIWIMIIILKNTGTFKARGYRKTLTDLYVAAKIRQLSKEDGLDLVEEYEAFKAWTKKQRIESQSLDNTIEEELQGKINKKKSNKPKQEPKQ